MQEAPCLPLSDESITRAADLLRGGGLVAFPTETVYGLGGDACNAAAVASIFAAKGRPTFNPLISHVASASEAFALGMGCHGDARHPPYFCATMQSDARAILAHDIRN